MPAAPRPEELLALMTRARRARVQAGLLSERQLYDVRAFKSCWADLGYVRRLALVSPASAHVATAMTQLVTGLSRMHPGWTMTGDRFADRDRHHTAVRRHLNDLAECGLLTWHAGLNLAGEEARTELLLHEMPHLSDEDLRAAAQRLTTWRRRYNRLLNTGSSTDVRNVARVAASMTPALRRRLAIERCTAARNHRAAVSVSVAVSAPPYGASTGVEVPTTALRANGSNTTSAYGEAAGARGRGIQARLSFPAGTAVDGPRNLGLATNNGKQRIEEEEREVGTDLTTLTARVRARELQREPIVAAIAASAQRRCEWVAGSSPDRLPGARALQEAWVSCRYGTRAVADVGPAYAGRITDEDLERLARAARRWERYAHARPATAPPRGLAALLWLVGRGVGGRLDGSIRALDRLSRRLRAHATATSPDRHNRLLRTSKARHRHGAAPAGPINFRVESPWPAWVELDHQARPILTDDLGVKTRPGAWSTPPRYSSAWRETVRDAFLLNTGHLPPELDGRQIMLARHQGHAQPDSYLTRPQGEARFTHICRLTGMTLTEARRLRPDIVDELLSREHARRTAAARLTVTLKDLAT